jgi:hypothetical protein
MAISYTNFLAQVRSYTEVDSNVLSDTLLDQFIRQTELEIAGQVDYDDLRKYSTSNYVASQRYLSLPSDCLILRSVQNIVSGQRTFLEKKDTSFISEYNGSGATGEPKFFANWDDFTIVVAPTPDSTYQVQINYIIDPPHFTSTNNTFLAQYQDGLLLYGVLTQCFSYLKGPMDMYNLYKTKYDASMQAFAVQQMGRRRRSEYDQGVPRIKVESPSP